MYTLHIAYGRKPDTSKADDEDKAKVVDAPKDDTKEEAKKE